MTSDQRATESDPAAEDSGAQSATVAAAPVGLPEAVSPSEAGSGPTGPGEAVPAGEDAPEAEPVEEALAAVVDPVTGDDVAAFDADATSASDEIEAAPSDAGDLEELTLPSLVQAPAILEPGTVLGSEGRVRIGEHLGTRGRVNRYAATWTNDEGEPTDIELREGPADQAGLPQETEILTTVQYAMLPRGYQAWEQDDRRYLALDRLGGETLGQALQAGIAPDEALSQVLQLAQVVRRLHRAGWALLGLTPADVYLGQPLRVGHLGHAARIGETPLQALQVASYSAPELAHRPPVTGKEDVYMLGALLYHTLAGSPLPESGLDLADLPTVIKLPGVPQLLIDVLVPPEERLDLEAFYQRLLALRARRAAQPIALEVASATTVGLNPTRSVNEDSCAYATWMVAGAPGAEYRALLCVADGMGGMEAGEIASGTAVNVVMQSVGNIVPPMLRVSGDAEAAAEPTLLDPVAMIRRAATAVHAAANGRQLGTTITCVAVQGGELTLGHVGDTRAYLLRGGVLAQITADHSLVAAMVASGVITKEEARGHPDSNKVLRSLGSQRDLKDGYVDDLEAAFGQPSLRLEPGDWLILCSDGVWGSVEDSAIQTILTEAFECPTAARVLVDRALQAGAPDNATVVVARVVAMPAH